MAWLLLWLLLILVLVVMKLEILLVLLTKSLVVALDVDALEVEGGLEVAISSPLI